MDQKGKKIISFSFLFLYVFLMSGFVIYDVYDVLE